MGKLYQIGEDELAELERTLPQWQDDLMIVMASDDGGKGSHSNRLRVQIRRVQDILKNVRWGYGPAGEVQVIPAG